MIKINPMSKKKESVVDLPFGEDFKKAWEEWIDYRKERRLPAYKPIGLKRTFAGIIRDSNSDEATACEMILQAIEKNWQGIFPLTKNQINERGKTGITGNQGKSTGAYQLLNSLRNDLGINGTR